MKEQQVLLNDESDLDYQTLTKNGNTRPSQKQHRPPIAPRFTSFFSSNASLDRDAVHFGVRMSVCITLASLFILLRRPGEEFPQAMWIVITVLFVCWFPSLDAASVVEKSIQRLYGTAIGSLTGILCGFLSLALLGKDADRFWPLQSAFLIFCIATYTFAICWAAVQYKVQGRIKVIAKYKYACILSLLTFYICVLPFYSDEEPKWEKGLYRVTNVIVGCILGACLSIFILPRSTTHILRHKMELQIQLAGEASQAVLYTAADSFSDDSTHVPIGTVDQMPLGSPSMTPNVLRRTTSREGMLVDIGGDVALEKYESAIKEWRSIKTQLGNIRYDPFNIGTPDELLQSFRTEMANAMARALRIQNTVLLLDGIVRNDPKHDFGQHHIDLFAEIGNQIRHMLSVPLHLESNEIAYNELKVHLAQIRSCIIELSSVVASSSQEMPAKYVGTLGVGILGSRLDLTDMIPDDLLQQGDDKEGKGSPKFVHGSHVCALLFLQLVEHLALRSVRLYQSWKHCESVCDACERRDAEQRSLLMRQLRSVAT